MALDPTTGSDLSNQAVQRQIDRSVNGQSLLSPADVGKELAAAYHAYAKEGDLAGADLSQGGTLSLLESAFITDNTTATVTKIATGICNYWATNITAGAPAHGGTSVVSVVINSAAMIPAMTAAITATITTAESTDGFKDFYEATEAVVKTFPCVVTELIGAPPVATPFPELIS